MSELKSQIEKDVSEAIKTEIKKLEELESTVACCRSMCRSFISKCVYWHVKMN